VTYALLALIFVGISSLPAVVCALTVGLPRSWWRSTAIVAGIMVVLTAVFDSAMIALDLFRYGSGALLGARVALVPVEDFAWPMAAALALPALWVLTGTARGADADSPQVDDTRGARSHEH
jgi:lycopene cyclase domain-containing protein